MDMELTISNAMIHGDINDNFNPINFFWLCEWDDILYYMKSTVEKPSKNKPGLTYYRGIKPKKCSLHSFPHGITMLLKFETTNINVTFWSKNQTVKFCGIKTKRECDLAINYINEKIRKFNNISKMMCENKDYVNNLLKAKLNNSSHIFDDNFMDINNYIDNYFNRDLHESIENKYKTLIDILYKNININPIVVSRYTFCMLSVPFSVPYSIDYKLLNNRLNSIDGYTVMYRPEIQKKCDIIQNIDNMQIKYQIWTNNDTTKIMMRGNGVNPIKYIKELMRVLNDNKEEICKISNKNISKKSGKKSTKNNKDKTITYLNIDKPEIIFRTN